jgi:hypothetical protein
MTFPSALAFSTGTLPPDSRPGQEGTSPWLEFWEIFRKAPRSTLTVATIDGRPINGARLWIGKSKDKSLTGTTDSKGVVVIPKGWTQPEAVTVEADGFVRKTYPDLEPKRAHRLVLSRAEGGARLQVSGVTSGYGEIKKDGFVDFALVMPGMRERDLISFDISSVVSPETDVISIFGREVALPSNLALPKQTENYFLPITIEKPKFRTIVRQPGDYKFVATRGRFPLSKVVDDAQDRKSVFEMIKHFEFIGGGEIDLSVKGDVIDQKMDVSRIAYDRRLTVKGSKVTGNLVQVAVALTDRSGVLLPTDIKRVAPGGEQTLKAAAGTGPARVLSLLRENNLIQVHEPDLIGELYGQQNTDKQLNQMSLVLQTAEELVAEPQFLDLVAEPKADAHAVAAVAPRAVPGVRATGTMAILSEIEIVDKGQYKIEVRTRIWEVFKDGAWVDQINLPEVKFEPKPNRKYRWEMLFLGSARAGGGGELEQLTHVSRNAVDLR